MHYIDYLVSTCKKYSGSGIYIGDIPMKKRSNAAKNFPISSSDQIIALIDSTVFGSCKTGLAICADGLYWRNDNSHRSTDSFLDWGYIANLSFESHGIKQIRFSDGNVFDNSGGSMKTQELVNLLNELTLTYQVAQPNVTSTNSNEHSDDTTIWFYAVDGNQEGPYPISVIMNHIVEKGLNRERILVWRKGLSNWEQLTNNTHFSNWIEENMPPELPPALPEL